MQAWFGFFQTSAEVSATLLGLLVVAISINLLRILDIPHLPDRAGAAMIPLAGVLVLSMLAQVPGQSVQTFGAETLAAGLTMGAMQARGLIRSLPHYRGAPSRWLWSRIFLTQGQGVPALVAAVLMILGRPEGLYCTVPAVIFALVAAEANAWVLLVEVLR
jgi:modulator of FtsH protease